jgi:hypothetical protein
MVNNKAWCSKTSNALLKPGIVAKKEDGDSSSCDKAVCIRCPILSHSCHDLRTLIFYVLRAEVL